jgi:ADP-ribose pyrophosphatase
MNNQMLEDQRSNQQIKNKTLIFPPLLGKRVVVYENQYSKVYKLKADFGEFSKEYFVTYYGRKSGLVIIRENSILMVRQYRVLINERSWEIPGGKIDEGETPTNTAVREAMEETGLRCFNLKPLFNYRQSLDILDDSISLFYTKDFDRKGDFIPNPMEVEAIEWIPFSTCLDMVFTGKIQDSFTIIALLAYKVSKETER